MSDKTVYSRRNLAIDMLRALTMFIMIFVNDFWKVHDVPHWLEHASMVRILWDWRILYSPAFCLQWECPYLTPLSADMPRASRQSPPWAYPFPHLCLAGDGGVYNELGVPAFTGSSLSDRSILVPDGHRLYRCVEPISETGFRHSEEPFPCF